MFHRLKIDKRLKSFLLAAAILFLADQFAANNFSKNSQYIEDPELFWRHQPGRHACITPGRFYIINSQSLREPDIKIEHPSIMMLGDSCTFGLDVSEGETIEDNLESIIYQNSQKHIRVYNAGCPGYSSQQMLCLFRQIASRYKPNIVICAPLYGDTDFSDMTDKARLSERSLLAARKLLWKSGLYRFLTAKSHTQPNCDSPGSDSCIRVDLEDYKRNICEMRSLAENNGAKLFIILYYPRPKNAVFWYHDEEKYKNVAFSLQNEHTIVIDLLDKWNSTGDSEKDLFLDIIHPNSLGYKKAAEDIYSILSSRQEYKTILNE